jgi:hypothetical protein
MPKLVVLITPLVESGHAVGEAWQEAGAPGVTFVESYGLRRLQEAAGAAEVLPGMMSMFELLRRRDENSVILFSVVADDAIIDRLISATEAVIGDIGQPDNGILFTLNVERAKGITRRAQPS